MSQPRVLYQVRQPETLDCDCACADAPTAVAANGRRAERNRYHAALGQIAESLAAVEVNLTGLKIVMQEYASCTTLREAQAAEEAGLRPMWPHLPARLSMESRNGSSANYLYVYWNQARDGTYQGPAGQRKLYIGSDPQLQALARRMEANRRQFEQIERRLTDGRSSLAYRIGDLERLARECDAAATRTEHAG